jgi:hypothetical protein
MTKIITAILFMLLALFFVWQLLIAVDKQVEMNHQTNCQSALNKEDWTYLKNNCGLEGK